MLGDILRFAELANATIALHDIDPERLRTSEVVGRKIARQLEVAPVIEATTACRRRLDDGNAIRFCQKLLAGDLAVPIEEVTSSGRERGRSDAIRPSFPLRCVGYGVPVRDQTPPHSAGRTRRATVARTARS